MTALVLACFFFCLLTAMVEAGLELTPFETVDGRGHKMGFNDRLYPEHFLILWKNLKLSALPVQKPYACLLLFMQLTSLFLIWSRFTRSRYKIGFYLIQLFLFPLGWLAMIYTPIIFFWNIRNFAPDRETFTDIPTVVMPQGLWIGICLVLVTQETILIWKANNPPMLLSRRASSR